MKVLVVVDMQKDFINGSLGTKEAEAMLPKLVEYVKSFDGDVIFTKDTHTEDYMNTQEGKNLPVRHCIKGTDGWELADELESICSEKNCVVFEKPTFPSKELAQYLCDRKDSIDEIIFTGVCTDICVVSNALTVKAFLPETQLSVIEELTEATSVEMKAKTLDVMRCCQIKVI